MEILLRYLPMLACPLIMGTLMWAMSRNNNQTQQMQPGEQACHAAPGNASPLRKVWSMVQCCLNWKVLAGVAAVGVGMWLAAPALFASALPVLLILICPLSMVLMLRGMSKKSLAYTRSNFEAKAEEK